MENPHISVEKSSLSEKDLEMLTSMSTVQERINTNVSEIMESPYVKEKKGVFSHEDYQDMFDINGAMKVAELDTLGKLSKDYLTQREGRFFTKNNKHLLRGPRYIVAIDPNLSVPQKLEIYKQDYLDGDDLLKTIKTLPEKQYKELSPILDYMKNSVVTLYNAYTQKEKLGEYKLDNPAYQNTRENMVNYMRKIVSSYYLSLVDELRLEDIHELVIDSNRDLMQSLITDLHNNFKDYTFSSRFIVRPEASHPLVNLGVSYLATKRYPNIDTVVGFPSGSTEVACATADMYQHDVNKDVDLILFPFSLHSVKKQFKDISIEADHKQFFQKNKALLNDKEILLIDDNSSTGRKMKEAHDTILQSTKPSGIMYAVAEADIIRSQLNAENVRRTHIAHPDLYNMSIGLLPVSRRIEPKHDLREIKENKQLADYYLEKSEKTSTLNERVKFEVFADGVKNSVEDTLENEPSGNVIDSFHDTFLSNFYPVSVELDGVRYPTVEHAYQRAKFELDDIKNLAQDKKEEIQELLARKGFNRKVEDFSTIFLDADIKPGAIKKVADLLRTYGLVQKNWDDKRVDIMIDLLMQKYQNPDLAKQLQETGDKTLVEGNSWNDTYWGVVDNRGGNMLGRILMNIREKLNSGDIETFQSA